MKYIVNSIIFGFLKSLCKRKSVFLITLSFPFSILFKNGISTVAGFRPMTHRAFYFKTGSLGSSNLKLSVFNGDLVTSVRRYGVVSPPQSTKICNLSGEYISDPDASVLKLTLTVVSEVNSI